MLQALKRFWLVWVLLLSGVQSIYGFALIGPLETWQIGDAGFGLAGDDGGPKNISDEFRWNTRYIYYAYDESFLNYFGTNMATQIDEAFDIFNSLTNFSSYSSNLTEWPLTTTRFNYTAESLTLLDAKSMALSRIANLLGLAQPERYLWNIHDRYLTPGTSCPIGENYVVVQRNFDPVTQTPSSYVNGTLYDYTIIETCVPPDPIYLAFPIAVDPTAPIDTAVVDGIDSEWGGYNVVPGRFYTGLTRDDIGGLRYLMDTNRMNVETVDPNSLLVYTNNSNPQLLVTSNLSIFLQQAMTNTPTNLVALYPGLIITATSNYFSNVVSTNILAYFTNYPNAPAGTLVEVFATNYTTNVQTIFVETFANVVTNHFYSNGFVTTSQTNIQFEPGAPAGTLETNVTTSTVYEAFPNGDFYLIPSNALCGSGYQILSTQLITLETVTNVFGTNITVTGATNTLTNGQFVPFSVITYFTNYSLVVYPIQCQTNAVALREGIDHIVFVRQDFDSLLGTAWTPVTNTYNLTAITNGAPFVQTFYRVINQPDIDIVAKDQIIGPATPAFIAVFNNLNYNISTESSDGLGPGTIFAPTEFVFGKGGGPIFWNQSGFFVQNEAVGTPFFEWGSFDGSTNAPVVYPSSISLQGLQTQVFFQITSGVLPAGSVSANTAGNPYSVQLVAQGASPPFTWALATNSAALPAGLSISAGGVISGPLTGDSPAIYDFMVAATDSVGRITEKSLFIQVNP